MRWNKEDVGSLRHTVVLRLRRIRISEMKGGQLHRSPRCAKTLLTEHHGDDDVVECV